MPQSVHDRAAEFHNKAAHTAEAAAASKDHGAPTPHELTAQEQEDAKLATEESHKPVLEHGAARAATVKAEKLHEEK
jgi:hypothetical protein